MTNRLTTQQQMHIVGQIADLVGAADDLGHIGVGLLLIAAARAGETLLESRDYYERAADSGADFLLRNWDRIKTGESHATSDNR